MTRKQIEKYFSYQKYFPYRLVEWEKCLFVLHDCVFCADGTPRWQTLLILMGRGGGKNGYLSFEDFCLITPTHGIKNYDIDICATSEEQAKTTFDDIYDLLDNPEKTEFKNLLKKNFKWTKTEIKNLKTGSKIKYRTNNAKSKDGLRSGKVDFDEYHAFVDYSNVKVFTTGLGKKPNPRKTIITTDGEVRGGPLDNLKETSMDILYGRIIDNGILPFICRLDSEEEVNDKTKWQKANPTLEYLPTLFKEMELEYNDYVNDPINNSSFMTKRMNIPRASEEENVTSWDNICATGFEVNENGQKIIKDIPDLTGHFCVAGIDYASFDDIASACLNFKVKDKCYSVAHSWICSKSKDLPRIKAPLRDWEKMGLVTFVNDVEISPYLITNWLQEQMKNYHIKKIAIDKYKLILMRDALMKIGFNPDDHDKVKLIRPSDIMLAIGPISSGFNLHKFVWGDNPLMRWATWNTKLEPRPNSNFVYAKKEAKSRKTDPFMAFVHSYCLIMEEPCEEVEYEFMDMIDID